MYLFIPLNLAVFMRGKKQGMKAEAVRKYRQEDVEIITKRVKVSVDGNGISSCFYAGISGGEEQACWRLIPEITFAGNTG